MVELVLVKIEPTDQRLDGTIARIQCNKGALDFGKLGDFPTVLRCANHPDDGATPDFDVGRRFIRQA